MKKQIGALMMAFVMMMLVGCASRYTVTKPTPESEAPDAAMIHIAERLLLMEEDEMAQAPPSFMQIGDDRLPDVCRGSFSEEGYTLLTAYAKNRFGSEDAEAMHETVFVTITYIAAYAINIVGDGAPPLDEDEEAVFVEDFSRKPGMRFFECVAKKYGNLSQQ